MSAPKDEKYIVFKRDEFAAWKKALRESSMRALRGDLRDEDIHQLPSLDDMELQDAVVIRRQDAFAPPVFDAYSNCVLTAVEVLRLEPAGHSTALVEQLESRARYMHEQAVESWDTVRKLPD